MDVPYNLQEPDNTHWYSPQQEDAYKNKIPDKPGMSTDHLLHKSALHPDNTATVLREYKMAR
jgi:hypothetical protein